MGTELISNYEKMKNEMAGAFLKYDQEAVIRKFDLKYDEAYLYLDLLSRAHRISRKTGQVTWSEDGFQTENPADYNPLYSCRPQVYCRRRSRKAA